MDGLISNMFELWGLMNLGDFSDEMYYNNFYNSIFLLIVGTNIVVAFIYYYAINHPRLNRWYWWLTFGVIGSIICSVFAWNMSLDNMQQLYREMEETMPYSGTSHFFPFSLASSLISFFFYFISSIIIKWWSRNCKHSPF